MATQPSLTSRLGIRETVATPPTTSAMEASVRILHSPSLSRRLLLHTSTHPRRLSLPFPPPNPNPRNAIAAALPRGHRRSLPFSSQPIPSSNPFASLSHSISSSSSPPADPKGGAFHIWDSPVGLADGGGPVPGGERRPVWTVVLLGWLGAEHRHLKRYAEVYNARGIRSVRFVVPVKELLGFDLGRKVEGRIADLARDLVSWCSETEEDGRERRLLFHTFSNTGWLAYGAILENFQSRRDIIEKINGCVVDSGPAPELSPKVWAAGFGAALLKKRSSSTYPSTKSIVGGGLDGSNSVSNIQNMESPWNEIILLSLLEKFFSIVLMLPEVNQRLSRIISTLSKKQPACPQLYLYSSADKVVPVLSVERFIQGQKTFGREVDSHDFVLSPHVDHFRSFPDIYSAKIDEFLKECCSVAVSQTL